MIVIRVMYKLKKYYLKLEKNEHYNDNNFY